MVGRGRIGKEGKNNDYNTYSMYVCIYIYIYIYIYRLHKEPNSLPERKTSEKSMQFYVQNGQGC